MVQTSFDLVRLREAVGAGSEEALNEHVMPILARPGIRVYGSCVLAHPRDLPAGGERG